MQSNTDEDLHEMEDDHNVVPTSGITNSKLAIGPLSDYEVRTPYYTDHTTQLIGNNSHTSSTPRRSIRITRSQIFCVIQGQKGKILEDTSIDQQ
jgi:hypothetical protein